MVVCNTSLMQLPAAYISGLCQLSAFPAAITCNQRFQPLIAAPAPIPCAPPVLPSATIRCPPPPSSPRSTPPETPIETSSIPCSGVNLVSGTTNLVSLTSPNGVSSVVPLTQGVTPIVPLTQGFTSAYLTKLANTQVSTSNNNTSSPQCIYTPLTSAGLVQCTPRIITGQSVLQCTPGVCPMAPTILPNAPLEVLPSTTVVPNPPTYYFNHGASLPSNLVGSTAISSWKQSYGMEQVWQYEFKSLFSQYIPHSWLLLPVLSKPDGIWNTNVDSAKVRFCCEECGHGWTSMKGRVAFWFVLNPASGEGVVCLKLYGQQCDRCKSGNYEAAMWYPEEVLKVLVNIYNRVGQVYYGFQQAPYHRARRAGKPRTPHNSELCQACKDGVCSERR